MKTPDQIAEQKRKWWGPERNAARRRKYAEDPSYRDKAKNEALQWKQRNRNKTSLRVDCRKNVHRLDEIGTVREIVTNSGTIKRRVFTRRELAEALGGYVEIVIARWIRKGLIPEPVVTALEKAPSGRMNEVGVFLEEEVVAMIKVLAEHQKVYHHYRVYHEDTIQRMFANVEEARKGHDIT